MESHELFLKYNYVLRRGELKTTVGQIYEEYLTYCRDNGIIKPLTKIDLNKKLKEIGIESYKSNKDLKITLTADELAEIAKCQNWVHETDEYYDEEDKKEKKSDLDYFVDDVHPEVRVEELEKDLREEKKQHHELSIKFDEMKAQLEELRKWKNESFHQELKLAYEQEKELSEELGDKARTNYLKWYNTLSKEEKKIEDERKYNEGAHESVNRDRLKINYREEYKMLVKKQQKLKTKNDGIQFIDDETPKPQILDLDSLIENAPEGKLIQVSDETKEKINLKGKN